VPAVDAAKDGRCQRDHVEGHGDVGGVCEVMPRHCCEFDGNERSLESLVVVSTVS
jgi:hypothetical protein